ncbi:von Willebrand factor C and EGF domain-containing protein isoform X2 [Rhinatrema bivittatum]|uniref:von Willebrand factor C and EGF domain-containing protein isoform X2 n=1 Tax=Rhinatrema bivittatum TaxID=194408 RepID=UPI001128D8F5|nr:von Willebrand factor C and EGF domain-containing protein isoform X2 [Rhinatrema bivittatum]
MFPVLLLEVSCLFIFCSEIQGKAYSGRKRPTNSAAQRHRFGPHVCHSGLGIGTGCCPGWAPAPGSGQCILPLCSFGCGSGFCIAPNVCSCRDGQQGITCPDDGIAVKFLSEDGNPVNARGPSHSCLSAMCEQSCLLVGGIPICSCFLGYSLGKDGRSCYDVDECTRYRGPGLCQQLCKNSIGSYRCHCYYGYQITSNGRSCIPLKQHSSAIAGAVGLCGEYGCDLSCNHGGCEQVSRVCPLGFTMIEMANGITCADINECTSASCEGLCVNTEGGFVCECRPGLQLSADRHGCVDIDECSGNRSPCQQRCKNSIGSYRCSCGPGFHLHANGHSCTDINECRWLGEPHLCQHSCHNTFGSFFCACRAGFLLSADRVSCDDVDECSPLPDHSLSVSSPCQQICTNTAGSYLCSCDKGYQLQLDGHTCQEFPDMIVAPAPILSSQQYRSKTVLTPLDSTLIIQLPSSSFPSSAAPSDSLPSPATSSAPDLVLLTTFPSAQKPVVTSVSPLPTYSTPSSLAPPTSRPTSQSLPPLPKLTATPKVSLKDRLQPTAFLVHPTLTPSSSESPSAHLHESTTSSFSCWYQGEVHTSGSHWMEPGCLDCSCQEGRVFCEEFKCSILCSHPLSMQQNCCPLCDGCLYEGVPRADGEVFSLSADNCTVCICLAGNVTCVSPECAPVTCPHPFFSECCLQCPAECVFQGQIFPHGAEFSQDGDKCRTCVCRNGDVECSFTPCPVLDCPREDWLLELGHCCFRCQKTSAVTGCPVDDNGIEFPVGQIWSPGDPCEICICQSDGSVACKRTNCLETCPHPILIPGQCCPDCSAGCSYHGKLIQNNETFPSSSDPCLTCICLLGSVACSPVECTINCTYPFHAEEECCPVCHDCTYEGRKVLNGQTFLLEKEHCTQCTCQLGEVRCEEIVCQHICMDPYIPPGECCSTCEECLYEGQVLEDGDSYTSKADPCVVCHCDSGDVHCEWRGDSCPKVVCHQSLMHVPGECCPICLDAWDATFPQDLIASSHVQDKTFMKGSRYPRRHTPVPVTSISSNPSLAPPALSQQSQLLRLILKRNTVTPGILQKITPMLDSTLPSPVISGHPLSSPDVPSHSYVPGVLRPSLPPIISSFPTFHAGSLQSTSIHASSGISSFMLSTTVTTFSLLQVSRHFTLYTGVLDSSLPPKRVLASLPSAEILGSPLPPATTLIPLQPPKSLPFKEESTVAIRSDWTSAKKTHVIPVKETDGDLLGQKGHSG